MISRLLASKIEKSAKSILLLGPRQVGKSSLIRSLKPDLEVNLAREEEFLRHSAHPELLESLIAGQKPRTVFIDEIQRVPSMLNTIQHLIDTPERSGNKGRGRLKFYLTGSSARKLRRGQANLLPGRVFTYHLGGLCARELDYQVDLERALHAGLLPEPYLETSQQVREKLLGSYSATYLREEIQAEALTRNLQGFARFLTTAATLSGSVVDYSKIATKTKVSRSGCVRFFEMLEDTLVAARVLPFNEDPSVDSIKHPKLFFFDIGVLNGLLNSFDTSIVRHGLLFEHFIYSQLINSAAAHDIKIEISFFRSRGGTEVDFIVRLREKLWAIEVKSGEVNRGDLSGLLRFRQYYPETHRCLAVSSQETRREIDQILICSWSEMLKEMGL